MRPETQAFIGNGQDMLRRARVMLGVSLYEDAGRTAYMAAFHAAQALIFEREQRIMKSHHGVRSEFHRLVREGIAFDPDLLPFLSRAYRLKVVADYDLGSRVEPPPEEVAAASEMATRFVEDIRALLP